VLLDSLDQELTKSLALRCCVFVGTHFRPPVLGNWRSSYQRRRVPVDTLTE
jgi:hypothetical protein